ncbi:MULTISPECIES: LysR family transcriptional regulator [unclassified Shewanella]|uniref:LysR family transcriptional regulator n=1 Tax=unclassified Shewanella TaxID=196818 RepID=UPI000C866B34|nr:MULTISPECIES: LysR family transcriptional regulator [unclassified Shewanella]MDO6618280.1 LysR family transcriptional regulator [Shewanella sp. 6_MG-2023]MDO6641608.1 LysR family transcriptional regulator [Shewanella sp. 5_MG-2023]MDO6679950.1 LysR family transcriptional regulator [Shewanella sp. 4_MG-2023]MDO6775688.1 LysR family transcriptional regulator [Shewanella sp. 3_MG-2023]PMG39908.1 LysR family transcriptional regulator [Shewanella sp. 10N.286.52.B9]
MKIDLNLFVVFDAIYCEGNITKAASVLNLSQPAVSHSLGKLRAHFDDALFVRQGNEMRPTPVAKNVIADVREALHQLQVCLVQSRQFEPSTSRENFSLSLHGSLEPYYLPPLQQSLSKESPTINLRSNKRVRRSDLENKLASGDIDLAIDALIPVSNNILHTQLELDQVVVVARKEHPTINSSLDLDTYLHLQHVLVSSRSTGPGLEDFELSRLGLHRKISLRCQHPFSACRIITNNDMLLTLPRRAAEMYSELFDINIYPMPVELPGIDVHLYWHVNVDKEPANKWLRNKMIMAASNN